MLKKILYARNMAPSLSHEAKQLVSSANDLQRLTALEVDKCSKCGLLLNMPLFFKAMERNNPYQMRMTKKMPRFSIIQTKIRFTQKYEVQYRGNMPHS